MVQRLKERVGEKYSGMDEKMGGDSHDGFGRVRRMGVAWNFKRKKLGET